MRGSYTARKSSPHSQLAKAARSNERPGAVNNKQFSFKSQVISASSRHEAGYSKLVLWDNTEGWGGEGGGGDIQDGETRALVDDSR